MNKVYAISMLLILSGATGTFVSLDILLFYVFYEVSIIPVFFLMGVFGHGNKFYATFMEKMNMTKLDILMEIVL